MGSETYYPESGMPPASWGRGLTAQVPVETYIWKDILSVIGPPPWPFRSFHYWEHDTERLAIANSDLFYIAELRKRFKGLEYETTIHYGTNSPQEVRAIFKTHEYEDLNWLNLSREAIMILHAAGDGIVLSADDKIPDGAYIEFKRDLDKRQVIVRLRYEGDGLD